MNLLKSELRYSTPFRRQMKVNPPISPILTLKLVAIAMSLSDRKKKVTPVIYDQCLPTIKIW